MTMLCLETENYDCSDCPYFSICFECVIEVPDE